MNSTGSYVLLSRIGTGGMAEVFKAIKKGPGGFEKPVALKRILPFLADREEFIRMLSAEARLHAHLDHPNLVQILDFFREGENYIIALEYVPGENLRKIRDDLRRSGDSLPWMAGVYIVCEILKGLDYAHKRRGSKGPLGIVHRDVSPHNIMVAYDGWVKLTDFGIALANIDREDTASGVLKGKSRYLAPEQLRKKTADARSDLFSAAVVLYELVCGHHPFDGDSDLDVMNRIVQGTCTPSRTTQPDLPESLHAALEKALSSEPSARYADAGEFREALRATLPAEWVSKGQEFLRGFMERLYPIGAHRGETEIDVTKVAAPTVSVDESFLAASLPKPMTATLRETKSVQKLFLGSGAIIVSLVSAWGLSRTFRPEPPIQVPMVAAQAIATLSPIVTPLSISSPSPEKVAPAKHLRAPTVKNNSNTQATGAVRFSGPQGTTIYLQGQPIGRLPMPKQPLQAGTYTVSMKAPGKAIRHSRFIVETGKSYELKWDKLTPP